MVVVGVWLGFWSFGGLVVGGVLGGTLFLVVVIGFCEYDLFVI